ncbi:glycosyltransferase family 4 protein [Lactococcus lactis]|uniref:Glycosyltransferase n=1 Tax=Lactococcus lactis TaxID=1358 RepID=A0A6M0MBS5_9LACT|nr:glycosyltransferase [Lactococcus lactis]NEX51421.1 glycosyltransferase [Lactococcus lactis]NEX56757.1 glycosyltransferase [Lactococcus lactis]
MLFFINSTFNQKNSGIEHAQLKRASLFREHKEAFKLVFREWNPSIHRFLAEAGVSESETLCMFDYFQKTEHFEEKILHVEDLDFGVESLTYNKEPEQSRYLVFQGQQLIARVRYFGEDPLERVSAVEYFDGFGNLYRVDFYDFRGFLSLSQWYTPDNKIGTEVWMDIKGKPVLETFNKYDGNHKYTKSGWRLNGADGAIYNFTNIDELTLHFLNLLNEEYWQDDKANIFIMDRTYLADWALLNLDRPAYTVLHLHNSHAGNAQEPMHSVMNNFYEFGLMNSNGYDAIVSATEKQTLDVSKRFNPQSKLFTIPVGVVPNEVFSEKRIDMKERKVHSVLVTARVAPEKRIDHIIRAIGIARQTVPDITLDFYGYVDHRDDDSAQKAINAAIKEYHMEEAVHQFEYANNVGELQKEFQVYALASIMEGFNLSLMEAISHGMVGVTYDVNYGPNELIVDGENGFVVPYEGIQEMADRLVELFTQEDKLQKMSIQSYELARRYSEENVWKAWQALIDDANKKNIDYRSPITEGIGDQRIYSTKKSK